VKGASVDDSDWASLPDERLLDLRLGDLPLSISESPLLTDSIRNLRRELRARRLNFRPHFWLSDEWFTPDGVPGIASPFYLAHPRLARLEASQMLEVEGGTPDWCMRILRHEAGHAIENAFRLRRRKRRIELFGKSSVPYPEYYSPRAHSRSYVLHLDSWYAQSHPDEDFAETFAVWLANPADEWRRRYAGWPALKKLEFVDELMGEIAGRPPVVTTKSRLEPLHQLTKTLREHYRKKHDTYDLDYPNFYDRDLRRLFSADATHHHQLAAATFVRRIRRDVRRRVARWTGAYQYTIDQVLEDIIKRCRAIDLRLTAPEEQAKMDFTVLLAVHTMNYLHSGRHLVAL
jgi:hypothetical protein